MECLSFDNISESIRSYRFKKEADITSEEDRSWRRDLQEFNWCKTFALGYLNKATGIKYEVACKDNSWEPQGIDVILHSKNVEDSGIKIQVVDANEHDHHPSSDNKDVDHSGNSILTTAMEKCAKYCKGEINTKDIILLIHGLNLFTRIDDLMNDFSFLKMFEALPCFKNIYYITQADITRVHTLKKI